MNKVILIGHLGRDPEMRYTPQGQPVTAFSVATNWGVGEKQETEWFMCSAFGKQAELCNEYLAKGSQVFLEGRIKTREYQDRHGKTRFSLEVLVTQVQFLGQSKSDNVVDEDEDRDLPILDPVTPYALNTTDGD